VFYLIGSVGDEWRVVAQVFVRRWPWIPLANYEVSCGPIFLTVEDYAEALRYLDQWAAPKAVRFDVGPRWPLEHFERLSQINRSLGFEPTSDPHTAIYSEETALVDLRPPAVDILKSFRYTTRYEIRRAQSNGVVVRFANDARGMEAFFPLFLDQKIHQEKYHPEKRFFDTLFECFLHNPRNGVIALSLKGDKLLAAAIYYRLGKKCIYRYGASDLASKKEGDTSHLMHWQAMQYFKNRGCEWYDFCGASPSLPRDYPTWGVNLFKIGFSKHFERSTPDFSKSYRSLMGSALRWRGALSAAGHWFARWRLSRASRKPRQGTATPGDVVASFHSEQNLPLY
jgi:hypothetical protein